VGTSTKKVTVIGYDGSEPAQAALRCAARRADPGTRLVVAHAAEAPTEFLDSAYYEEAVKRSRERGAEVLEHVADRLDGHVDVETAVLTGPPARSLVKLAHEVGAGEIVVGSRGLGRFRAALGSVSHELLHEADLPLVVVPGAPDG
jgi:nucleotide-binding universal stress UspA family protein